MSEETKLSELHPHDMGKYYLFTDIDNFLSADFLFFMDKINKYVKKGDYVDIHINSPGGSAFDGFTMYDAIRKSKHYTRTYIHGSVGSAATLLSVAANERIIDRNSLFMLHQHSSYGGGKMHEKEGERKVDKFVYDKMVDIYAKNSDLTKKQVKEILLGPSDLYLTANEAKNYGLVDKVV